MRFKQKTIEAFQNIADNEEYGHFFSNMKNSDASEENPLIECLAELLIVECNMDWEELDKVKFFMGLSSNA